jgi:hypothetical protein
MNRFAAIAAVCCVAIAGVAAGQALAHPGSSAPIYRNTGHACAYGATDPFDQVGHFYAHEVGATIDGTVELDQVAANATYPITLVQNHPCVSMFVGHIHTDSHGNGTLDFQASESRGSYEAFILPSSRLVSRAGSRGGGGSSRSARRHACNLLRNAFY